MKKSIPVNKKSRGRPKKAGGVDPVSAVRLPSEVTEQVDAWGEKRELNRSEAIRRLVELGLTVKSAARPTAKAAARAAELAAKAIDKHADTSAPSAERESRKNMKGPSVFWDVRKDSAK
jgi:Arc/MetJ-type ribon-helix-helix transcriptional regulator